ncbi:hypothetical protein AB0I95_29350 [Micromonospora sp. NPDC049751]|uniref:hypothetical protein n=1 Tax=unclassified Micromonospora TaxID=2617518 RepID=UPI0033F17035
MATPSKEELEVAIEALRQGGMTWQQNAEVMQAASSAVTAQSLGSFELSAHASITGLVETYGLLQEKVATLLRQGADNFEAIGAALKTAADGYEQDEIDEVHRQRGIY